MHYLRLRVQSFRACQVSLFFTSTPLQLALDCNKTAFNKPHYQPPLTTDDIMDLLYLCLTSTDFQCNSKHYKQLHGTAIGSPASAHVAEIVMQNINEHALATYCETLPLWPRSVDDMITAVHKKKTPDEFNEHFNKQNTSIQFTQEIEENGKISFLDCLVTRENNTLPATAHKHSQPTPPNVLQSYFTQSDYSMNPDEKSAHSLPLRRQFERRNQAFEEDDPRQPPVLPNYEFHLISSSFSITCFFLQQVYE